MITPGLAAAAPGKDQTSWMWSKPATALARVKQVTMSSAGQQPANRAANENLTNFSASKSMSSSSTGKSSAFSPVLVIGSAGVNWNDFSAAEMKLPGWEKWLSWSGIGNNNRQSQAGMTCPISGWLSLGAGMRISETESASATESHNRKGAPQYCQGPEILTESKSSSTVVSPILWQTWQEANRSSLHPKPLGVLAEQLKGASASYLAIGDGAMLALSDSAGKKPAYQPRPEKNGDLAKLIVQRLKENDLVMVDVGEVKPWEQTAIKQQTKLRIPKWDREKRASARGIIERIDAILQAIPEQTTVLVLDLADNGPVPHLGLAMRGQIGQTPSILGSQAIRQKGLVQTIDFTQEILTAIGQQPLPTLTGGRLVSIDPEQRFWNGQVGKSAMAVVDKKAATKGKAEETTADSQTKTELKTQSIKNWHYLQIKSLRSDLIRIVQPWFYTLIGVGVAAGIALVIAGIFTSSWRGWSNRSKKYLQLFALVNTNLYFAGPVIDYLPLSWVVGSTQRSTAVFSQWSASGLIIRYLIAQIFWAGVLAAVQWLLYYLVVRLWAWKQPNKIGRKLGVENLPPRTAGISSDASGQKLVAKAVLLPELDKAAKLDIRSAILWTFGPVISLATSIFITLGVLTGLGSPDQVNSVIGSTAMTATRFYGMNNNKYGYLLAVLCALVAWLGVICQSWIQSKSIGGKVFRLATVLLILVAVYLDGYPTLGCDVGGPLGLLVGAGLIWLLIFRGRIRWWHGPILVAASAVAIVFFAWVDYLAPVAKQTHLARFLVNLRNGVGLEVVHRKATMLFNSFFGSPLAIGLTLFTLLVGSLVAYKYVRTNQQSLSLTLQGRETNTAPMPGQRALLTGLAVATALAVLMNDTGAVILVSVGHFLTSALIITNLRWATIYSSQTGVLRQSPSL